jgi:hypothetical protein
MVDRPEKILRAAIMIKGLAEDSCYSLPPPARHHNVLHTYRLKLMPYEQGFITSAGRFVDREEAVNVAIEARQLKLPKRTNPQHKLFSEDLW